MSQSPTNKDTETTNKEIESIRRIRYGCVGMSVLITALAVILIFMTQNLAWSLLLIVPVILLLLRSQVR